MRGHKGDLNTIVRAGCTHVGRHGVPFVVTDDGDNGDDGGGRTRTLTTLFILIHFEVRMFYETAKSAREFKSA